MYSCADAGFVCPGSSFTAIAASFATQGYFIQSDIIYYLLTGDIGAWAPLLYILSAAGGMVGVALGMPPRNYMWFFIGPAIYHWLLGTPMAVHATEWRVGNIPQDQREVWKLAEVGLVNSRIVRRLGYQVYSNQPPELGPNGDGSVDVAMPFAWYDSLVSNTVQWLIQWTGVYGQNDSDYADADNSNLINFTVGTVPYYSFPSSANDVLVGSPKWHLLSNLKWSMLEDITQVMVHTPDLRDAFVSFMASECGDKLSGFINPGNFAAAQNAKGNNLPDTVFYLPSSNAAMSRASDYTVMTEALGTVKVPVIPSLKRLMQQRLFSAGGLGAGVVGPVQSFTDPTSFYNFFNPDVAKGIQLVTDGKAGGVITCDLYFTILMDGFRWEAGHHFHQLMISKRPLIRPEELVYNLFYGWDIKGCGEGSVVCDYPSEKLTINQEMKFLQDMILVHLIRNEMRIAPKTFGDPRTAGSSKIESYTKTQQRTVGEKTKYGEVYTWANLVPYVQGVLLYILAIGYPFACVLIVVPGWHKTIFTWMSFWAWAKLWDLGFAVVQVIERTVWAMMGNSTDARGIADKIVQMQSFGTSIGLYCDTSKAYSAQDFACLTPTICDTVECTKNGATGVVNPDALMQIYDRALVLSANLDLDLANAYYIYIMAALYMAVPAVTGQMVLGAKAGVSGLVSSMIGGVASEAGRAAGSGYSSDMTQKAKADAAALGQTAYMKGLRNSPYSHAALQAGNRSADLDAYGAAYGQVREAMGHRGGVLNAAMQATSSNTGTIRDGVAGISRLKDNVLGAADQALTPGNGGNGQNGGNNRGLVGGLAKTANNLNNAANLALDPLGRMLTGGVENAQQQGFQAATAANYAMSAQAALNTYRGQAEAKGWGLAQSRLGAAAHFDGENAAWAARNDYATQQSGELGAMGVNAGVLDPGPKPTHFEGAAMMGMLGQQMNDMAHYSDGPSSPFFQKNEAMFQDLQGKMGEGALNNLYANSVISPQGAAQMYSEAAGGFMTSMQAAGLPMPDSAKNVLQSYVDAGTGGAANFITSNQGLNSIQSTIDSKFSPAGTGLSGNELQKSTYDKLVGETGKVK